MTDRYQQRSAFLTGEESLLKVIEHRANEPQFKYILYIIYRWQNMKKVGRLTECSHKADSRRNQQVLFLVLHQSAY